MSAVYKHTLKYYFPQFIAQYTGITFPEDLWNNLWRICGINSILGDFQIQLQMAYNNCNNLI